MRYEELLRAFCEKLGGKAELTPNDDCAVMLSVDDMPVTILGLEEVDMVAIMGVIGEPPPADRMERLYKAMLEANHNFAGTGGAMLSINPETGNVSLCKLLTLSVTDGDTFFREMERFVNVLEMWCKIVENYRGAELDAEGRVTGGADASVGASVPARPPQGAPDSDGAPDADVDPGIGPVDFMRV